MEPILVCLPWKFSDKNAFVYCDLLTNTVQEYTIQPFWCWAQNILCEL